MCINAAIACADVARMHYLAVNTYWLKEDYSQVDQAAPFDEFLNLLPSTIVHRQPQVPLKPLHLTSYLVSTFDFTFHLSFPIRIFLFPNFN